VLQTKKIEYFAGQVLLEGYCAFDDKVTIKRPAVLVVHDWSGRNDFADQKAKLLAEMGYVAFAVDLFGKNILGKTVIISRLQAAIATIKELPIVDATNIGAIGFCFGGLCVLDLARHNLDVCGVVSFHGLFTPLAEANLQPIHTKILALHGQDDPMAPPAQVASFTDEMTRANADWQLHIYGKTQHAFTNPDAHDEKMGTVYNNLAAKRSWLAMKNFLTEIFN
jgi:dienelactone hydrolase